MVGNERWVSRLFLATGMVLLLAAFSGCGAGYRSRNINGVKTVTYVDENGNARDIYRVEKDGRTTIYDENDPMARRLVAQQAASAKMEQARNERLDRIKAAPKRASRDPIYVVLFETELGENLAKAEKPEGAVYKAFRKEFEHDRICKLVNPRKMKGNAGREIRAFLENPLSPESTVADVSVTTRAFLEEQYGISKKKGKPARMVALVFEATITSHFLPRTFTVRESGHILNNPEVTRKFAAKVRRIIVEEVGPTIPKDRSV